MTGIYKIFGNFSIKSSEGLDIIMIQIPQTHLDAWNPSRWSTKQRGLLPFEGKHVSWFEPETPGSMVFDPSVGVPTQQYFLMYKSDKSIVLHLGQVPEIRPLPLPQMPDGREEMFAFPEPASQKSQNSKRKRRSWKKVFGAPYDILKWILKKWLHPSDQFMRAVQLTAWSVAIVTAITGCVITLLKVC
jgi:hypothetical protein